MNSQERREACITTTDRPRGYLANRILAELLKLEVEIAPDYAVNALIAALFIDQGPTFESEERETLIQVMEWAAESNTWEDIADAVLHAGFRRRTVGGEGGNGA